MSVLQGGYHHHFQFPDKETRAREVKCLSQVHKIVCAGAEIRIQVGLTPNLVEPLIDLLDNVPTFHTALRLALFSILLFTSCILSLLQKNGVTRTLLNLRLTYLLQDAKISVCLSEEYFEKFNFFIPFLSKNEWHLRVSHLKQKQTEHPKKQWRQRCLRAPHLFMLKFRN